MPKLTRRPVAGLAAAALGLAGAIVASGSPNLAFADDACTPARDFHLVGVNDFHGRVEKAVNLYAPLEKLRKTAGEDNVFFLSAGDDIGGSTFVSAVDEDFPSLDIMKAMDLTSVGIGNHEFDRGWSDIRDRIVPYVQDSFPYIGANVYKKGTTEVAEPLLPYKVFNHGGITIGVVGAVTDDLPSLVSPAGIADLDIGNPVVAVNKQAELLKDGDPSNGEAEIVLAAIHEGSPVGTMSGEEGAAASEKFANMYHNMSDKVDVIFTGHTHYGYTWVTPKGQPIVQTDGLATGLVQIDLKLSENNKICSFESKIVPPLKAPGRNASPEEIEAYKKAREEALAMPRLAEVNRITEAAVAKAKELGAEVLATAEEAVSTAGDGGNGVRDEESPLTNMVADMFYDIMNKGNPEFIGIQNPGGTRASFDKGDVTYEEAANILPFANSLFTTKLTGAQVKTVLEQQWQRDGEGKVPARPYLALGLSKNVSYTFDESRPEGNRITSIYINGNPIDPEKLYTVGSGSFLVAGGDNFREMAKGMNPADFGEVDLSAWVKWLKEKKTIKPEYNKRGISVQSPTEVKAGEPFTVQIGKPGEVYKGTLDMKLDSSGAHVSPQLKNATISAFVGDTKIGDGIITDGSASLELTIPANLQLDAARSNKADIRVRFEVQPSATVFYLPLSVIFGEQVTPPAPSPSPSLPTVKPTPPRPNLPRTGV